MPVNPKLVTIRAYTTFGEFKVYPEGETPITGCPGLVGLNTNLYLVVTVRNDGSAGQCFIDWLLSDSQVDLISPTIASGASYTWTTITQIVGNYFRSWKVRTGNPTTSPWTITDQHSFSSRPWTGFRIRAYQDDTEVNASGQILETGQTFTTPALVWTVEGTYTIQCTWAGETKQLIETLPSGRACNPYPVDFHFYVTPPTCEEITTQTECQAAGCYWYNGACHTNPPTCAGLNNQADCERYGCYWWDNACHTEHPPPQEVYIPPGFDVLTEEAYVSGSVIKTPYGQWVGDFLKLDIVTKVVGNQSICNRALKEATVSHNLHHDFLVRFDVSPATFLHFWHITDKNVNPETWYAEITDINLNKMLLNFGTMPERAEEKWLPLNKFTPAPGNTGPFNWTDIISVRIRNSEKPYGVDSYMCVDDLFFYKPTPECEGLGTKAECEGAGCYWYNGACHAVPPYCSELTTPEECQAYGCYWYDGSCHASPRRGIVHLRVNGVTSANVLIVNSATGWSETRLIPVDLGLEPPESWYFTALETPGLIFDHWEVNGTRYDTKEIGPFVIDYGSEVYLTAFYTTAPIVCGDYTTQSECEAAGCYWYDGSCHSEPKPLCVDYKSQAECEAAGCYWYDATCHSEPKPPPPACEDYTTQVECEGAGCFWYDNACHATPQTGCTTDADCPERYICVNRECVLIEEVCMDHPYLLQVYNFAKRNNMQLLLSIVLEACRRL